MREVALHRRMEVVALACGASVAITVATGVPIVRIVARDVPAPTGCTGGPDVATPDAADADWAMLPFDERGVGPWPSEIACEDGRLRLDLPLRVDGEGFEATLLARLADHQIRIVGGCSLVWKGGVFTTPVPTCLPRRAERLDAIADLPVFAIDPSCRLPLVARAAAEARHALVLESKEHRT